jgi:hypothetical protein
MEKLSSKPILLEERTEWRNKTTEEGFPERKKAYV